MAGRCCITNKVNSSLVSTYNCKMIYSYHFGVTVILLDRGVSYRGA